MVTSISNREATKIGTILFVHTLGYICIYLIYNNGYELVYLVLSLCPYIALLLLV